MKQYKIYPGWWIVAACFLIMALQFAPSINLTGLFVSSIATEFGATRTAVATSTTIMIFSAMGCTFFSGRILTRFDIRKVMCLMLLVNGITNLGYAFAPSLGVIYFFSIFRGFAGALTHMVPISILVNNWFGHKIRGRAVAIAMVGSGIGSLVLNPIVGHIIHNISWRYGYLLFASFAVVLAPFVWFTVRRSPAQLGLARLGDDPSAEAAALSAAPTGLTVKQALSSSSFWLTAIAFTALSGVCQCWNNNGASFLTDIGFAPVTASSLLSATAVGIIAGKLLLGFICDRFGTRFGVSFGMSFILAGYIVAVLIGPSLGAGILVSVLMGLGISSSSMSTPLVASELFGNRDYGVLVGYLNVGVNLGASLVPLLLTYLSDVHGHFNTAFIIAGVIGLAAVALVNLAYKSRKKDTSTA